MASSTCAGTEREFLNARGLVGRWSPSGRVAPGDCSPGAAANPYLHFRAYGSSYHELATGRLPELISAPSRTRRRDRCCFVSTVMGFDAPAMFPSNGVMTWRPLLSTESLGMVPPLQRYYGTLRLPAVHLDPFDFFTSRYHRVARGSLPSVVGVPPGARELSVPVSPSGLTMETSRYLRFPGNPGGHCPCSSTPAGSGRLRTMSELPDTASAYVHDEGSPRLQLSGLNHTTFDLAVYASQGESPHRHARLASGCWSGFARRDSYPQGFNERFQSSSLILLPKAYLTQAGWPQGSNPLGPPGPSPSYVPPSPSLTYMRFFRAGVIATTLGYALRWFALGANGRLPELPATRTHELLSILRLRLHSGDIDQGGRPARSQT